LDTTILIVPPPPNGFAAWLWFLTSAAATPSIVAADRVAEAADGTVAVGGSTDCSRCGDATSGAPHMADADCLDALEDWVERGNAPDRLVATRAINGVVDRLRPLCGYPKVATYTGSGDTNDASNFVCTNPAR
jgi:hypothetical protein